MKPAKFQFHRPSDLREAAELIDQFSDAEIMAGNQSLGIIMANRMATPNHIVDIKAVEGLNYVDVGDSEIEIGATTRHRDIERSGPLERVLPMLPEAAEQIAGPSVRNRGTIGGSLAEADRSGNYPTALAALDGVVNLFSVEGTRSVPVADFLVSDMLTDLRENELIRSVTISAAPFPPERSGMVFLEFKRTDQSFPLMSAATALRLSSPDPDGEIEEVRIALGNVEDTPLRVSEAEAGLVSETLTEAMLSETVDTIVDGADPLEEVHADEELKLDLAEAFTRRSLKIAYQRATESAN